jgi:hypothetical protein
MPWTDRIPGPRLVRMAQTSALVAYYSHIADLPRDR